MRTGNGSHEEEEFGSKNGDPSFNANNINSGNKDGKSRDKAALRSKHSVTEQRRRSKINERFQRLRDLIPNPDQKRDTASFLLEVIEYVRYLQEKVKKYENSPHQAMIHLRDVSSGEDSDHARKRLKK